METQLQEEVKQARSRKARDRTDYLQGSDVSVSDKKQPQHCLVATLDWEHSGIQAHESPLGSRAGLWDGPLARLRCSMPPLLGLVLVQL